MTFLFNQIDLNNKDVIATSGTPLCTRVPACTYVDFEGNGTQSMWVAQGLSKNDQFMIAGTTYMVLPGGGGDTNYGTNVTKAEADAFDGYYYEDNSIWYRCTNNHQ